MSSKILCIEDDRETANLLAEDLVERGYEVLLAHDGHEGLSRVLSGEPDLVLCDINMPVLSGFEVLERLKALAPRVQEVPFVFLTSLRDRNSELRGRQLGADDYITKPIDFDILHSIIQVRLSRLAARRASIPDMDLTEREIEALVWSARGKTSGEIATILGLSKRTVDFHVDNARNKLGVATRIEAVVKATATGILGAYKG